MSKKRQALDPNNPVVKKLGINALFRDLDQQRKQDSPEMLRGSGGHRGGCSSMHNSGARNPVC